MKKHKLISAFLAGVISFSLGTTTVFAAGGEIPEEPSDIHEEANAAVEQIFDIVEDYGVIAENTEIKADFESNLWTDNLNEADGTLGSSEKYASNNGDEIIIGNVGENVDTIQIGHDVITDVVIGDNVDLDEVSIEGPALGEVSQEEITTTVAETLDVIESLSEIIAATPADVEIDRRDMNNEKIDAASVDAKIVYADVTVVNQWDGSASLSQQEGGMKIYINNDQICIVNVKVNEQNNTVVISRFTLVVDNELNVCGNQQNDNVTKYSDQLMFNFGDYTGEIIVKETMGTIIAPGAAVIVQSTSSGHVACEDFSNPGGEWHYTSTGKDEPSDTPTPTPEVTPTVTPTPEVTPEITPTPEVTPTVTPEVTPTPEITPTVTPEITEVPTVTPNPPTETPSETPDKPTPAVTTTPTVVEIPDEEVPLSAEIPDDSEVLGEKRTPEQPAIVEIPSNPEVLGDKRRQIPQTYDCSNDYIPITFGAFALVLVFLIIDVYLSNRKRR